MTAGKDRQHTAVAQGESTAELGGGRWFESSQTVCAPKYKELTPGKDPGARRCSSNGRAVWVYRPEMLVRARPLALYAGVTRRISLIRM